MIPGSSLCRCCFNIQSAIAGMNRMVSGATEVSLIYTPWDVYDQRLNLMMSAGEPFELLHVQYMAEYPRQFAEYLKTNPGVVQR